MKVNVHSDESPRAIRVTIPERHSMKTRKPVGISCLPCCVCVGGLAPSPASGPAGAATR